MELPKWNDDQAMLAWIGPLIPKRPSITPAEMEMEALHEARQGHFKKLGYLLNWYASVPGDEWQLPPLSQEAYALLADCALGKKARKKARRGAAKQTVLHRWHSNRVHLAADEVVIIEKILRQHYPKQRRYRDRALDLSAARSRIRRDRLAEHFKSEHRIPFEFSPLRPRQPWSSPQRRPWSSRS